MNPFETATTVERRLISKSIQLRQPINGSIELLPLCNMNCRMCYVRLSREEMEKQGRLRTVDEWLKVARQMKESGVLFLLLTGGEPLIYPGFKELYQKLWEMGMILTINTNATLIDEEWAAFFKKYRPRRINITLYGADDNAYTELCRYPGGFEKTMNGIRILKEYGHDVKIGVSLTKANEADLDRFMEIGKELGVPVRVDTYMLPATRERNMEYDFQSRLNPEAAARAHVHAVPLAFDEAFFRGYIEEAIEMSEQMGQKEEIAEGMSCLAGKCSFTINWQGMMRPCVISSQPEISVFDKGFENAWKYIAEETDKIRTNSKCSICKYRPTCQTCAVCALSETGSYDGVPEYMCRYAKEVFRLLEAAKKERVDE